jgi:pyruvate/2-oxoglutarate dehydrogenase complex dihydrolipoamide acyltransferase (E2) component
MTLMVTIGGVTTRPVLAGTDVVNREFLPLTLSFDHTIIDGAPAARFATHLRSLLENAAVLEEDRS